MKFYEVVDRASELLRSRGRASYRALQVEFDLTDTYLEALKEELIEAQQMAVDEGGKVLVWTGDQAAASAPRSSPSQSQPPSTYTPKHLAERIRAEQQAMESRGAADGERKTITALFADLKGSTALIEGLDPEDARAIIDPALQIMMDAVHRYDGYVAQALGNGIFALFGAPIAHEDHPQRALYAALRMQEQMRVYSDQLRLKGNAPLHMRVGINTGEVVVRSIRKDDLHTDYVPVGHSTNLAARMEQMANPGSIVISEYTRKLTEGYFELKALGAAEIKGVDEPLNVYEVVGAGPLRTRLQVSARRGLSRFVGRHVEMDQMQQALEQAKEGHGQIVGVVGEPGLGKSRLFYEFKLTSQSGCLVFEAFSVSYGQSAAYLPLIELLKEYFQIEPGDDERTRGEKVTGKVLMLDRSLEEIVPYLFSLLGIDDPTSSLQQMDAQIRRQRTFDALKKLFLRESLNQPLVLIVEDLHWIDTETQGLLDILSESVASANLLLLTNYRPEYRHEWGGKTYYTQLRLAPLGKAEAEELLTFLLGSHVSLNALKSLIMEKTEGTPFFMEEVVQTLVEEGAFTGERASYRLEQARTALHVSPTVQGVLAARIDRLAAEEKALLQQLSVIGRQFPLSLIKHVVTQSEDAVYRLLSSLQAKEFVYEQPAFPEMEYVFKHALTQDVAYGTVLQEQRKGLHERTGQALEALYAEKLEDHYSELAHHYRRSDKSEKAITYLGLAGQQAIQRSANEEGIPQLTNAIALLKTLPTTPEHTHQELTLHLTLGPALIATEGYATTAVENLYTRARALCEQVGNPSQLFSSIHGLCLSYLLRAEMQTARKLGEEGLRLAERVQDPLSLVEAHYLLGNVLQSMGESVPGLAHHEQAVGLYNSQQHHSYVLQYGQDPGVICRIHLAICQWNLGYPDQARQSAQDAQAFAAETGHPYTMAYAQGYAALVHVFRRDAQSVREQAEAVAVLAMEQGFPNWLGFAAVLRGWALATLGHGEESIEVIREGIAAFPEGQALMLPQLRGWLAEALGIIGHASEGLRLVQEARKRVEEIQEHYWAAELPRVEGELLLQSQIQGQKSRVQAEAEGCFQRAIEVAQNQQSKSFELRAATSLARLWQGQGKRAEARDLLAPVYDWFTEGFDTADLKDAKAILDGLS